ncbi:MAG TPA: hypothetical protein VK550_14245 [Polyangiaceae bacterium]|nr:hypothetical protein [Polyangiaceae bacterium]
MAGVSVKDDNWTFWRRLLSTAATELFAHYGVDLKDESHWTPVLGSGDLVAASVYFGGDQIRGGLTVCAPRSLLSRATPTPTQTSLSDFAREIANQILGGLQFALNDYDVDFSYQFSDPKPLPSAAADLAIDARTLVLRSLGGEVALIFVVASSIDLGPQSIPAPPRPSLARGSLIML